MLSSRAIKKSVEMTLEGDVEQAVGPVRAGQVVRVDKFAGLAYVSEDKTSRRFKLSRRFVDHETFDALREGTAVRFRENGHNAVAAVRISD